MCLLSIVFAFFDQPLFKFRFVILFLHTIVLIIGINAVLISQTKISRVTKKQVGLFIITLLIVTIPRLYLLTDYPFVSLGDELRDGALDAMKIAVGSIINIFEYGSYGSHGLIIPSFNAIFWNIFHSSVLSYRLPSALVGICTLLLFYLLIKKIYGNITAFSSTVVFSSLGLQLFYSRTETVVIFSGFITILDLLIIYLTDRVKKLPKYIIVGLLLGFNLNFHASVSTVALLFAVLFLISNIKNLISKPLYFIFFLLSFVAGFGPRILFTELTTLIHTSRLGSGMDLPLLASNYYHSLGVYSFENTVSHYLTHEPILTPIYSLLFFMGIFIAIVKIKNNRFLAYPLLALLILPFTNSAITDMINGDHRLLPLLPVVCIIISVGLFHVYKLIPRFPWFFVMVSIFIYSQFLTFQFFIRQNANNIDIYNWRRPMEYLSMHLIYFIKSNPHLDKKICIKTSPQNVTNYNYMHYQEQYRFFLPQKTVAFINDSSMDDNTAAVLEGDCIPNFEIRPLNQYMYKCKPNDLKCPLNFSKDFTIYY